jgi:hypothetical protein
MMEGMYRLWRGLTLPSCVLMNLSVETTVDG